ncbi:MAG TPA: GAF domain-containing protein [Vicinamibacterales bacterium]|jgi:GAF domain-containing protein
MADEVNLFAAYLAIHPTKPEEQALRLLVDVCREIVGADESSLVLLDSKTGELVFVMTTGSDASEAVLRGQRIPAGRGVTGLAVATGEVQMGTPTFTDLKQTERVKQDGTPDAVLAAPLFVNDRVIGAITAVSFRTDKRFTAADGDLTGRFAAAAALIIDQRRHIDAMQQASGPEAGRLRAVGDAEQRVLSAFGRIVQKNPDSLEQIARLLESIEALVLRP